MQVLVIGGKYVRPEVAADAIALIGSTPELHAYATRQLYNAVITHGLQYQALVQVPCLAQPGSAGQPRCVLVTQAEQLMLSLHTVLHAAYAFGIPEWTHLR